MAVRWTRLRTSQTLGCRLTTWASNFWRSRAKTSLELTVIFFDSVAANNLSVTSSTSLFFGFVKSWFSICYSLGIWFGLSFCKAIDYVYKIGPLKSTFILWNFRDYLEREIFDDASSTQSEDACIWLSSGWFDAFQSQSGCHAFCEFLLPVTRFSQLIVRAFRIWRRPEFRCLAPLETM